MLVRNVMDDTDREHLATNVIAHASDGVAPQTLGRVISYWTSVDPTLGARVAAGLGTANGQRSAAIRAQNA
jgi:catalase